MPALPVVFPGFAERIRANAAAWAICPGVSEAISEDP
jgi:hypothetical protein